jgi:hypothetical protein
MQQRHAPMREKVLQHTLCILVEGSSDIIEYLLAYNLSVFLGFSLCCLRSISGMSLSWCVHLPKTGPVDTLILTSLNLRSISRDSLSSTQPGLSISATTGLALLTP